MAPPAAAHPHSSGTRSREGAGPPGAAGSPGARRRNAGPAGSPAPQALSGHSGRLAIRRRGAGGRKGRRRRRQRRTKPATGCYGSRGGGWEVGGAMARKGRSEGRGGAAQAAFPQAAQRFIPTSGKSLPACLLVAAGRVCLEGVPSAYDC
ncbi:alpha-2A adrenergic receptor-like [Lathamus discolor]|uniref:alpha-2A adrenergic receptor-like n=1 Tax=Lathamus discolor TaxID=678569 RepID=UPI0032B7671C